MMNQPYTQRCALCGQDWWDSHVCPAMTAAAPLVPSPTFTVQVGGTPVWPPRPPAPEEALRTAFEKAFMRHYTNGAHLLERFDTGHYRSQEAQAAWHIAREFHAIVSKT